MILPMLTATRGEFLYVCFHQIDFQPKKIYSRFEEVIEEEPKKPQKRPRESDAADSPAKSDKKSKKLKAEDGKPVAAETEKKKEVAEKEEAKEEGGKKEKKKDKKEKKKAANTEGEKPTLDKQTTAGGVIIEDFKIGTGPMAKKGNTLQMRYIGKLTNGKEFDKNTKGKPVCRCGPRQ
jgi:FK506-binding nuclear protein